MRQGLALLTLFFGGVLFGTASCGKDEATGGSGGNVGYCEPCDHSSDCASGTVCRGIATDLGVCAKSTDKSCCTGANNTGTCHSTLGPPLDGSGGSAGGGIINNGGKGGSAGTGGTGGTKQTHLGQACVSDSDCGDSALTCLGSTGLSDGTGVAKGLCTMACSKQADCSSPYPGSFCLAFTNNDSYCIERCTAGSLGVPKCHERDEIACGYIGLSSGTVACQSIADCGDQQLCDDTGHCGDIITGCVPLCAGDFDCGSKEYCDLGTGLCSKTKPSGLPIGSKCTPPKTSNDTDPCQGFCDANPQSPTEGVCEALCVLSDSLAGCGWDGQTPNPSNVCLFPSVVSPQGDAAAGDLALCGALCDCNAQCGRPDDVCIDETSGEVETIWGRQGYCRPLATGETINDTFKTCPSSGGTGGTGGTGSGGEGGTPPAEGGSPGTGGTGGTAGEAGATTGGAGSGG